MAGRPEHGLQASPAGATGWMVELHRDRLRVSSSGLPPRPGQSLSPRQELALQRRRRLWWHGTALLQELREREDHHVDAGAITRLELALQEELHGALVSWLDKVTPRLPGLEQQAAQRVLQESIHALLLVLAGRGGDAEPQPSAPLELSPPDPLPSEEVLRARVEGARADLHQLQARAAAGELLVAAEVMARGFAAMRQRRGRALAGAPADRGGAPEPRTQL